MKRSTALTSSCALAAAPALALAENLTRIRVASSPNEDLIAVIYGMQNGAFQKAGLAVELQKANSGAAVAAAVAGGAVDVGKSSILPILVACAKGIPFVIVAPSSIYDSAAPSVAMVVAKDSPLRTARDLNGKIVAVSALNDLFSLGTQAWVDKNGGDSKTLRFIEVPSSAVGNALSAGRADAATLTDPQLGQLLASGVARKFAAPHNAIAPYFMMAAYFARTDFVAQNKSAVATFRRVVEEISKYANEHHEQMLGVLSAFVGIDTKVLAAQPKQPLGTTLDVRLVQPLITVAETYKALPTTLDARTVIDAGG